MDTGFMNSEKTSKLHVLILLNLTDKSDLRRGEKGIDLSNLSIYCTWNNIRSSFANTKFKISALPRNDKFQLHDGSYSVSGIQDYFVYILKKHNKKIDNLSVRIYLSKIENRITFKIKTGYCLGLLTTETMKLLGSTENKIAKDKNGENVPHPEITEVVLVHYNIVKNDYQQDSRVLDTFVPNKPFGNLLEIVSRNFIPLKTFNSEFQTIEVWFTDQNSQPPEIEDRIHLTLIIK